MNIDRILRANQQLLSGTAVLGLVSIAACSVANPAFTGVSNFTAGMVGNNLGAFISRVLNHRQLLQNEDLAKAAGCAVGRTLMETVAPQYPELESRLLQFGKHIEQYWLEWLEENQDVELFQNVTEERLVQVFSSHPEAFTEYQVLREEDWREVVWWLFERGWQSGRLPIDRGWEDDSLPMNLEWESEPLPVDGGEYADAMETLVTELTENFNRNLREVLKDDAKGSGQAFASMLFNLHGVTIAKLDNIEQRLQQMPTREEFWRLCAEGLRQSLPREKPAKPWTGLGSIDTVPKKPDRFLPRPQDVEALKQRLLSNRTLVMTGQARKVGVQGMGGIGKTVLAAALARENNVRRRFVDGVVWLEVGIAPKPIELYQRLATALGERYAYQESAAAWDAYLSELLRDKSCLLVLDDVWEQREAERFVEVLGENCQLLLTTRDSRLIDGLGAEGYQVGMLDEDQSLQLLAQWAKSPVEMLPPEAKAVAKECGQLPLALALAGAQVIGGNNWADVLQALQKANLKFFEHPHGSIYKAITTSIQVLEKEKQQAYLELGILAPDVKISEAALVKLWGRKGKTPEHQLRQWLTHLAQRALVFVEGQSPERWVALHDVQQKYLQERLPEPRKMHRQFLASYARGKFPWTGAEVEGDIYLYQQAAYHFREAKEKEVFAQLLGDFDWLWQKLEATDIKELLQDFEQVQEKDEFLHRLEKTLIMSAHTVHQDKQQFASQLWGRLLDQEQMKWYEYQYFWQKIPKVGRYLPQHQGGGKVEKLLQQAQARQTGTWFRPVTRCLNSPGGALICTLIHYTWFVHAVAVTPNGRQVVSSSLWDNTLKVWNLQTGEEQLTFNGHDFSVCAVAVTSDGKRVVSGSRDNTLKVWDLQTGEEQLTFTGHSDWIEAVAVTSDGKRVISGSRDNTLKVWDLQTGEEQLTLIGHSDSIEAVAVTPDGKRVVSGSRDSILKVWDLQTGEEQLTFTGHSDRVNAVAIIPDGKRVISGSSDNTLKVWNLQTGEEQLTFTGHSSSVMDVKVTENGQRAVSSSEDCTLKVWDLQMGQRRFTSTNHSDRVRAVAITSDGKRVISGSWDNTLKVWNLQTGKEQLTFIGHSDRVSAVAVTPDGKRVVSGSEDMTLKVWDLQTGEEQLILTEDNGSIETIAVTHDGERVVGGSLDGRLRVWDLQTGRRCGLTIHNDDDAHYVLSVAVTPDGKKVISGLEGAGLSSMDNRLKVWDLETTEELLTLIGHCQRVEAVVVTPNGRRVVSGSDDKTLKVWDLQTGEVLATFAAEGAVECCAIAPDGCTVVAGDSGGRIYHLKIEN